MKIVIANTKGGCGKTVSAMFLSLAAAKRGHSVELWDADSQGSATEWAEMAAEDGEPLPFDVLTVNAITVGKAGRAEITIVDTPPGDAQVIQKAIDSADLVIIPAAPSSLDLQRAWQTVAAASHRPAAVLITSAEKNTVLLRDTLAVFDDNDDADRFSTVITKQQEIRKSQGRCPERLYGYDELFSEITERME